MIAPLLVPAAPLAGAVMLLAIRSRVAAAWITLAAAGASFAFAAALPWQLGQDALLLVDPLSTLLILLTATTGLVAAIQPNEPPATSRAHALRLALLGFLQLALLSNNLGVTWAALQATALAAALLVGLHDTADARAACWRQIMFSGVGLAIALFGIIVLALATGADRPDLTWTTLAHAAPQLPGTLLNLAFTFLLAGLAMFGLLPLISVRTQSHGPATALLALSMSSVALVLILRLRDLLAGNSHAIDPGPPIMALGLATLLLAAFSLAGQRDARRLVALAATAQCGAALFAIGLGGPGATFAGLLHITLYTMAGSALAACLGSAANRHVPSITCSLIAIAALPPFGLFASNVLILSETLRLHPWLAFPLGTAIALAAWSLIAQRPSLTASPHQPTRRLALVPAWIALALSAMLGFAMPQPVAAWIATASVASR